MMKMQKKYMRRKSRPVHTPNLVIGGIEEEGLQENARMGGDYYKSILMALQQDFPCIGDVRGSGLFLGVELVKGDNQDPDSDLANHIKNELRARNILISTDGPFNNVLKTKPPLCFTKENADLVQNKIYEILKEA